MKISSRLCFIMLVCFIGGMTSCSTDSKAPLSLTTDKIYSDALGEEREFCLYLPENFDPQQTYPVVFATDGQIIATGNYKTILDNLIKNKTIPPVVLIGTNSNEKTVSDGMELRYYEYIENDSKMAETAGRFKNHLEFFTKEVRNNILAKYDIKPDTAKYIFYGCSNGGDYGLTLYAQQQELFADYICLSPVGTDSELFNPEKGAGSATLYVAYGNKEAERPVLGDNLIALDQKLKSINDSSITIRVFEGGHDRKCWEQEFATALTAALNR